MENKKETTYNREAYLRRREKAIECQKRYNEKNKAKVRERSAKYNAEHKQEKAECQHEAYHCGLNAAQRKQRRDAIALIQQLDAIAARNIVSQSNYRRLRTELSKEHAKTLVSLHNKLTSIMRLKGRLMEIAKGDTQKNVVTKALARVALCDQQIWDQQKKIEQQKTKNKMDVLELKRKYPVIE